MNLLEFRDAVIADLRAGLPALKVEPHGGRFDLAELDNYAIAAPEIRVAILAARRLPKGRRYWSVSFAAYPIAGRDRHMLASERGMVVATTLLTCVNERSLGGGEAAQGAAYQNLYSADSRERNKHLSAVTWTQTVELDEYANAPLDDFLKAVLAYDPPPEGGTIVATDTINLPPPEAP